MPQAMRRMERLNMTSEKRELIGNFEVAEGKLTTRREVLLMGALAAGSVITSSAARAADSVKEAAVPAAAFHPGQYAAKDYSHLLNKPMDGLSPKQIEPHLKLYAGYVGKANEIQTALSTVDPNNPPPNATYHPLRELLMEQSYALNGVVYHELYFGNLGGAGGEPTGDLRNAIEARWGSLGKFMDFFKASGKCMRGWVIVGWNMRDGQLHAYGLDLHNMWVPADVVPIVVLDVYEHAYMIDYGINRAAYLDAFLKNVDWNACNRRLAATKTLQPGPDCTA
jgi:Fe-Mn family superoxide dismutase